MSIRFLLLAVSFALLAPAFAAPPQAPEIFWLQAAKRIPGFTVTLWNFEGEAGAALEDLADIVDNPDQPGGVDDQATIGHQLQGDAMLVDAGRFGKGVHLAGKGTVVSKDLKLPTQLPDTRTLTFDFWVKPEADQPAGQAVLFTLAAGKPAALHIERKADGTVVLTGAGSELLSHTRKLLAGKWTHLALVVTCPPVQAAAKLLVDGAPQAVAEEQRAKLTEALRTLGPEIGLGAGADFANGFTGTLDDVRISRHETRFCRLDDDSFCDPKAERAVIDSPPYFLRKASLKLGMSFDGTLAPEVFTGLKADGKDDPRIFRDGVRSKALDLSEIDKHEFALLGGTLFPMQEGTVEFWFRPLNWANSQIGDYFGRGVGTLTLFSFSTNKTIDAWNSLRKLVVSLGKASSYGGPFVDINPGRWYHVTITWGGGASACYIDGKRLELNQLYFTAYGQEEYNKWLEAHKDKDDGAYGLYLSKSATLIDELKIYDRALSPVEVANAHARFYPDSAKRLQTIPPVAINAQNYYYKKILALRLACMQMNGVDPAQVKVIVSKKDGTALFTSEKVSLDAKFNATVNAPVDIDFGKYDITAESYDKEGKKLGASSTEYERVKPPWWQNGIGAARKVLQPWTPVKVEGNAVSVWGRKIALDAGGLPRGITSAGQEMLATPARMRVKAGGVETAFVGKDVQFGEKADDRAGWSGTLAAGGVTAKVDATVEYDGLMSYTVTLQGAGKTEIQALTVDFPLKGAMAFQLVSNGGAGDFRASHDVRMVPVGTGRVWDSMTSKQLRAVSVGNFLPIIWLGDDECGICFFGENDKGWTPDAKFPAQEIIRDGDQVIFRMNIICTPVTLDGSRQFKFSLHPTPVKPIPADWRTFGRTMQYDLVDGFSGFKLTTLASVGFATADAFHLEPDSWEVAETQKKNFREKFPEGPLLFYIDHDWPAFGPTMVPEYSSDLWSGCGRLSWTPEVVDYYVWIINEYLKRGLIDGLYIDDTGTRPSVRWQSGNTAYELPDGTWQNGVNTMGFRSFTRRIWALFEQYGKRPHIVAHMTWCFEVPSYSFIESALNGEDRTYSYTSPGDFTTAWSRDEIRIMNTGSKWGFVTLWIPEIKTGEATVTSGPNAAVYHRQARAMNAMGLVHDLWYMFGWPAIEYAKPGLLKFGVAEPDVTFIPYWKLDGAAQVTGKDTLVSLYKRPDRVLVMLSNFGDKDQKVTVTLDPTKVLGTKAAALQWTDIDTTLTPPKGSSTGTPTIKDPGEDGVPAIDIDETLNQSDYSPVITPNGNTLTLWVRRHDYRMIMVQVE